MIERASSQAPPSVLPNTTEAKIPFQIKRKELHLKPGDITQQENKHPGEYFHNWPNQQECNKLQIKSIQT